jgi:hypothetical protein
MLPTIVFFFALLVSSWWLWQFVDIARQDNRNLANGEKTFFGILELIAISLWSWLYWLSH